MHILNIETSFSTCTYYDNRFCHCISWELSAFYAKVFCLIILKGYMLYHKHINSKVGKQWSWQKYHKPSKEINMNLTEYKFSKPCWG